MDDPRESAIVNLVSVRNTDTFLLNFVAMRGESVIKSSIMCALFKLLPARANIDKMWINESKVQTRKERLIDAEKRKEAKKNTRMMSLNGRKLRD